MVEEEVVCVAVWCLDVAVGVEPELLELLDPPFLDGPQPDGVPSVKDHLMGKIPRAGCSSLAKRPVVKSRSHTVKGVSCSEGKGGHSHEWVR